MSNHYSPPAEFFKAGQNLLNGRRVCHHIVIDTGKLFDPERNRDPGIYKLRKACGNGPVFHPHSPNFNDLVLQRRKTGGLNVKHHIGIVQALSLTVLNDSLQVVHQISFHAVDHFKIRILGHHASPGIEAVIRLRERLDDSMIGDGNRFMSPFIRSFNDGFCIGYTVHVTHLCMAV